MKFSFKSKTKDFQSRGSNIFNVFTNTVSQLNALNSEIGAEEAAITDTITSLEAEKGTLATQREVNQKMIDKINSFIN